MIKLYTPNVDRYRGYEWGRNVRFEEWGVSGYGTTGFSLRLNTKFRIASKEHTIQPSWRRQDLLGIRVAEREVTVDRNFKPEVPINSLMLEICDKFLN